jgi:hypothetical protein
VYRVILARPVKIQTNVIDHAETEHRSSCRGGAAREMRTNVDDLW